MFLTLYHVDVEEEKRVTDCKICVWFSLHVREVCLAIMENLCERKMPGSDIMITDWVLNDFI